MADTVEFAKMNGLGNKILVVDMRGRKDMVTPEAAIALNADPATQFDQIMAIHDPRVSGTDAFIDILNCDGTKAQACGNGLILLPSRRAARALTEAFLRQVDGRPILLPRIAPIAGLDEAALALSGRNALDLPPAVDPVRRLATLTLLVMQAGRAFGDVQGVDQAWPLARALADLMDEAEWAECDLCERLPHAAEGDFAQHWHLTVQFLSIITQVWPAWLAEQGVMNPVARQTALLHAQATRWLEAPPPAGYPIWAAGFSDAVPSTIAMLRAVLSLPDGRLVLPGVDMECADSVWCNLPPDHPQAGTAHMLAELGLERAGMEQWGDLPRGCVASSPIPRASLLARALLPAHAIAAAVLPLAPGRATGNSLEVLDRRYARGNVLEFLAALPELMVFNDEAHHIHDLKREGEVTEVEWQKSLSRIAAAKGRRFVQVDFSATPYNDVGSGKNKKKLYFPHIVVDFDLKSAMRAGLVKALVLDRRKEVGALPLEFKAERDELGNPALSEGQRVMLRAGLQKLRKLEADFAHIDPQRHPKMLVVCEDTTVSPLVAQFLMEQEGLHEDEVMTIDSGKKAELGEKDWAPVRERLFNVDRHAQPRVIVSVLMLREGFDVNNICVIVPLRSSQAQILLEQTIGRGLRLMWREAEYGDLKRENRERIAAGQEPGILLDVLSIVEHPAFQSFYDELLKEGLAGTTGEAMDSASSTGDVMASELREGFEAFDFGIPFIVREAHEEHRHADLQVDALPAFTAMPRGQLAALLGKGDTFISQDLQSATLFGDYRVAGAVMNVAGYNDYLARLTRRISQALSEPLPKGNRIASHLAKPYLQVHTADLTGWLDDYVWTQLFGETFNPLEDENWRLLLL